MTATCKVTVMQGANTLKKSVSQVMAETSAYMRATDTNPSVGVMVCAGAGKGWTESEGEIFLYLL